MKKKLLCMVVAVVMAVAMMPAMSVAAFATHEGSACPEVEHSHGCWTFSYQPISYGKYDVSTAKAKCNSWGKCDLENRSVSITMKAPKDAVYSGAACECTFDEQEAAAWTELGLELSEITYYRLVKCDKQDCDHKIIGCAHYEVANPINAGHYVGIAKAGDVFISKDFVIKRQPVVIEAVSTEKQYGNHDPAFGWVLKDAEGNVIDDKSIIGEDVVKVGREAGEEYDASYALVPVVDFSKLDTNYKVIDIKDATLHIGKRDLHVAFDDVERYIGADVPEYAGYGVEGLLEKDPITGEPDEIVNDKIKYTEDDIDMMKEGVHEFGAPEFEVTNMDHYNIIVEPAALIVKSSAKPILLAKGKAKGKNKIVVNWKPAAGATEYALYGAPCGTVNMKKIATGKGLKYTVSKVKGKKLVPHKVYKFRVYAYKDGELIAKSKLIHVIAAKTKGKFSNATSVVPLAIEVLLEPGDTFKLASDYTTYKNMKHLDKHHGPKRMYTSQNPAVATVTAKGLVKAKKPGLANIWTQDTNGIWVKTLIEVQYPKSNKISYKDPEEAKAGVVDVIKAEKIKNN